jgi:hypothetical protein
VGGIVRFPRTSTARSEAEWHDPADNARRWTRTTLDASLVTWLDTTSSHESDDDSDGGGGSAA